MKPKIIAIQTVWSALYALGVAVTLVFWWRATGQHTTGTSAAIFISIGNITGLIGTYAVLWQLVLIGRLTMLENAFGMERLTWLHKWNGYLALIALIAHAAFLVLGYAIVDRLTLGGQLLGFITGWEDVLKATIGLIMLIAVVVISIGIVRRGLRYETWYWIHVSTYLAIVLGFSHQLSVGSDFVGQPVFRLFWLALYALAFGTLGVYRFLRPAWQAYFHRFVVAKVVRETPDTVSIYVSGRHLERFAYAPGQFAIWRFLAPRLWLQAHPFSFSIAPNGRYLRLTVKALGDFTKELQLVKPGTMVSLDGPHGNFTPARLSGHDLLLIAGGVGITPIRAMLEQLPSGTRSVAVIYAARTQADIAFRRELDVLAAQRGTTVSYVLSNEAAAGMTRGLLDATTLQKLVPDAASREIMLCGPPPMMDAVTAVLRGLGTPSHHIHTERFAY